MTTVVMKNTHNNVSYRLMSNCGFLSLSRCFWCIGRFFSRLGCGHACWMGLTVMAGTCVPWSSSRRAARVQVFGIRAGQAISFIPRYCIWEHWSRSSENATDWTLFPVSLVLSHV